MLKKLIHILLAFAGITLAALTPACAADVVWGPQQWGTNKFDKVSSESAIRRIDEGINPMRVPNEVKALWKEAVRQNPEGTPYAIRPGQCFEEMQSGSGLEKRKSCVPTGAVTAPTAVSWVVSHGGQNYVLVLPDICFNWAWVSHSSPPETPSDECTTVEIPVQAGNTVVPAVFASGDLPTSGCWGIKRPGGDWVVPRECHDCARWETLLADIRLPRGLQVSWQTTVTATQAGSVWIRVPRAVETQHRVAIYLQRDGLCSWNVLEPRDWRDHTFRFSEADWKWKPRTAP